MAALSSTTSTRRVIRRGWLAMCVPGWPKGQLDDESGAATQARTLDAQHAAHLPGGERAAVQPEAVPGLLGGEAVSEDAAHVLGGHADAGGGDRRAARRRTPPDGQ